MNDRQIIQNVAKPQCVSEFIRLLMLDDNLMWLAKHDPEQFWVVLQSIVNRSNDNDDSE